MKQSWPPYAFHLFCLFAFLTLAILPLLFGSVFGNPPLDSDNPGHIKHLQDALAGKGWPAHFIFHLVLYLLAGFKSTYNSLAKAIIALVMLCFLAKAWIAWEWLRRSCVVTAAETARTLSAFYGVTPLTFILAVATALMFAGPLVRPREVFVYLGQLTPNLYHNPTSLMLWPFALGLFFAGYQFLSKGRWQMLAAVAALSAVSTLVKPNYVLAFAPTFGLATLCRYRISRRTVFAAIALVPTLLILVWQLKMFGSDVPLGHDRYIAFMPLAAWRLYSSNIPYSLLVSLAFPAAYIVMFSRQLVRPGLLAFAWAILAVAIVWLIPFAEIHSNGRLYGDFDFVWGSHVALFPLFLVTLGDLLSNPAASVVAEDGGSLSLVANYRALVAWLLFDLHVASGGYWFLRQLYGLGFA